MLFWLSSGFRSSHDKLVFLELLTRPHGALSKLHCTKVHWYYNTANKSTPEENTKLGILDKKTVLEIVTNFCYISMQYFSCIYKSVITRLLAPQKEPGKMMKTRHFQGQMFAPRNMYRYYLSRLRSVHEHVVCTLQMTFKLSYTAAAASSGAVLTASAFNYLDVTKLRHRG